MIKMKLKIIFATSQSFESKEVKVRSTKRTQQMKFINLKKKYVPKIYRLDMDFNLTDKIFLPLVCDAKACY